MVYLQKRKLKNKNKFHHLQNAACSGGAHALIHRKSVQISVAKYWPINLHGERQKARGRNGPEQFKQRSLAVLRTTQTSLRVDRHRLQTIASIKPKFAKQL
jgi:hypothetical protein